MAGGGETYQERAKGKDVRTSNIVAAKVGRRRHNWLFQANFVGVIFVSGGGSIGETRVW